MLRYVPRLQKPLSVMVWAGISASGRTPLIFVPSGVKINASTYRELILEPVVKNLEQTVINGRSFVFQQDGPPAHTANATQDWLRSNISGFISKDQWPPYSPDLNPMDYSIWSILETKACSKSHKSIVEEIFGSRMGEGSPRSPTCRRRSFTRQNNSCN